MKWSRIESALATKRNVHIEIENNAAPEATTILLSQFDATLKAPEAKRPRALTTNEQKLQDLQIADVKEALHSSIAIDRQLKLMRDAVADLLHPKNGRAADLGTLRIVSALRDREEELQSQRRALGEKNPEAFFAIHARELRQYKRQIERGRIVETPFVEKQINKIEDGLRCGSVVFVHGHTGTGKTEISKIAAARYGGKEPIVLRGYAGMGSREMFGHVQLTKSILTKASEMPDKINQALNERKEFLGIDTLSDHEIELVTAAVLNENQVTVSEYILGAAYLAQQEGRVLLVDEANYIPPALVAKLYDLMTKKPGEKVNVQEDGIAPIIVQEGFGIIMTGNIDSGVSKHYQGRFAIDPALLDRSIPVEHNYIPQAYEGPISRYGFEDKQLYAVAIASLISRTIGSRSSEITTMLEDRVGTLLIPGGEKSLDAIWRLSQLAAITQLAFSGQVNSAHPLAFQSRGTTISVTPELCLSPRALIRLLEDWRSSGYHYEVDHYICKHLLDRTTETKTRAYFYQLAQKFKFFQGDGWDKSPNYSDFSSFPVNDPYLKAESPERVGGQAILESLYGEAPKRTRWPDSQAASKDDVQKAKTSEVISSVSEIETQLREIQKLLDVNSFCDLPEVEENVSK